jgi:hypothetical protein
MGLIRLLAALVVGGAHAIDDIQQQYLPAVPRLTIKYGHNRIGHRRAHPTRRVVTHTATFRTPRLHRAGARPVQGVLSRLITRTRISSDREGCRVGVAQLDCARLYSDDDFEPSQRQPSVQFALCGAARCASPVDTQVRLLSKLLRRQHYTLQTTQQSVTIETRRPIVGGRYETY